MRNSTSTFFMILAETLIVFIIFGMLAASKEVSTCLLFVLGLAFLFAYTAAVLYPKLVNKYGEKYYKLILILQNIFLSIVLFIAGQSIGYITNYITFAIEYFLIFVVTYYINRKIYIREIKHLNDIVKNSK